MQAIARDYTDDNTMEVSARVNMRVETLINICARMRIMSRGACFAPVAHTRHAGYMLVIANVGDFRRVCLAFRETCSQAADGGKDYTPEMRFLK